MISKKELLNSDERKWNETSKQYDSILIIPAGTRHESGYMHIAIIGVTEGEEESYEICGYPDDISFDFPELKGSYGLVRMDCLYPKGIIRYHGLGKFTVSHASSCMVIKFIK